MKTWSLVLLFCFPLLAHADLGGQWRGWLYWSFDGSPVRCDSVMEFVQTESMLERKSGHLDCDYVAMDLNAKKWILQSGKILEDSKVVGNYTDNSFHWTEGYSPEVSIESQIQIQGLHLDYSETWKKKSDQSTVYVIEGRLFQSSN